MDKTRRIQLKQLLLLALKDEGAEMGVLRNYDSGDDELTIISHHGFPREYLSHFYSVKPFDHSSCGRAFGIGSTIFINDIEHDLSFKKHCKCLRSLSTEFRAIKSVPVLNAKGKKLGVLSTHFKEPKKCWRVNPNERILLEIAHLLHKEVN